jgi:predicted small lipoprotein YifL
MVRRNSEHVSMNLGRTLSCGALIGVLAAALGLAACGRKGPLDLPPAAGVAEADAQNKADQAAAQDPRNAPRVANDPPPVQRRKPLPIDGILN